MKRFGVVLLVCVSVFLMAFMPSPEIAGQWLSLVLL
ncbi:unknown [Alistipes sp. CAG:157]|nr:unknown [Alistipes sp. CAG:157]